MIIELKLEKEKIDQIEHILSAAEKNLRGKEAEEIFDLITEIKAQKKSEIRKAIRSEDN